MSDIEEAEHKLASMLVGESAAMRALRSLIARLAPSRIPVWIEGETGVGKELVASALHAMSGRRGPCVAFNVCALSDSMFEDALFGHERGAFTGAIGETPGFLGEAHGGTLFLDEVSGLTTSSQVKLLRAIETGQYRRVGGRTDRFSDHRVVAASNEPFERLLSAGRMRLDLGFRLRGAVIRVPPLRERLADIPALVAHLLAQDAARGDEGLDGEAVRWMQAQEWPGNVRELRQLLHCASILDSARSVTMRSIASAREMLGLRESEASGTGRPVSDAERAELLDLLNRARWDTARVAAELGVDRTTVYRRMRRFGIDPMRPLSAPLSQVRLAPSGRELGANPA